MSTTTLKLTFFKTFLIVTLLYGSTPWLTYAMKNSEESCIKTSVDKMIEVIQSKENTPTEKKQLLEKHLKKVNINTLGFSGLAVLHAAVQVSTDISKWLIEEKKADVNIKTTQKELQRTPLHYAVWNPNETVIMLLLHGANIDQQTVAKIGKKNSTKLVLDDTPLHFACRSYHYDLKKKDIERGEVIKTLLRHGANINAKNANENTPLMIMLESASADGLESLLKAAPEANPNIPDYKGWTPLHYLCANYKSEKFAILTTLVTYGENLDLDKTTPAGTKAIDFLYDFDAAIYLINSGASITPATLLKFSENYKDLLKIYKFFNPEKEEDFENYFKNMDNKNSLDKIIMWTSSRSKIFADKVYRLITTLVPECNLTTFGLNCPDIWNFYLALANKNPSIRTKRRWFSICLAHCSDCEFNQKKGALFKTFDIEIQNRIKKSYNVIAFHRNMFELTQTEKFDSKSSRKKFMDIKLITKG